MFYRHNNVTLQFIYIHVVLFCVPRHSLLPANSLSSPPPPSHPELILHGNVKTTKGKREKQRKKEEKGKSAKREKRGMGKIRKLGKVRRVEEKIGMGRNGKGEDKKKNRE